MARYELGKWNLDELAKNPNRKIIDKKLTKIESDAKKFERIKKSLNPKVSSEKFSNYYMMWKILQKNQVS